MFIVYVGKAGAGSVTPGSFGRSCGSELLLLPPPEQAVIVIAAANRLAVKGSF
jgi:hypothetical protein